jgi:hypothetical protein
MPLLKANELASARLYYGLVLEVQEPEKARELDLRAAHNQFWITLGQFFETSLIEP